MGFSSQLIDISGLVPRTRGGQVGQGTRKFGWGDLESRGFCRKGVWGWEVEGAIVTVEMTS